MQGLIAFLTLIYFRILNFVSSFQLTTVGVSFCKFWVQTESNQKITWNILLSFLQHKTIIPSYSDSI